MLKRIAVFTAAAIAAAALAHFESRVVGAVGRGVAANPEGRRGHFSLEVKKELRHPGADPILSGMFRWEERGTEPGQAFAIEMRRVHSVAVNPEHTVCEFSGPARLVRSTPSGPVVVEGRLMARVEDRRNQAVNHPDLIAWQFVNPTSNVDVRFSGAVREGDIKVFARVMGR